MLKYKLVRLLNKITPKNKKQVVISSYPDIDDMTLSLVEEFRKRNLKVVILVSSKRKVPDEFKSCSLVFKYSILGVYSFIRAKYVFYTHGCFSILKPVNKQVVVNVWHGMPIKNIGALDNKEVSSYFHYILSTSTIFTDIVSACFKVPNSDVLQLGLPRNDVLIKSHKHKVLYDLNERYNKVICWLPTYRKSSEGDIRIDGKASESIFSLDNFQPSILNDYLAKNNELLIVKSHPMSEFSKVVDLDNYSNIIIINDSWLERNRLTLYMLLSISDTLWSDYSSVLIDYLCTGKPFHILSSDVSDYLDSRGFTFDFYSEFSDYFIRDFNDLLNLFANSAVYEKPSSYDALRVKYNSVEYPCTSKIIEKILGN